MWLGNVAALPWLQWSFSLWCGAVLRAELRGLRWWSFSLMRGSIRQVQLIRLGRFFSAWSTACRKAATSRLDAYRTDEVVVSRSTKSHTSSPYQRRRTAATIVQRDRLERLYAEVAWSNLANQLTFFVAWAGVSERSVILRRAVHQPSPCEAELLLCTFSAWVIQACLRGRLGANPRRPSASKSAGGAASGHGSGASAARKKARGGSGRHE